MYCITIEINVYKDIKFFSVPAKPSEILKWNGQEGWEHCLTIFHIAAAPGCVCLGRREINFDSDFLSLALRYLLKCLSPFIFYSAGSSSSSFNSSCFVT